MRLRRALAVLLTSAAFLALAVLYIAGPTGANQPFNPTLELVSISNSAPSANADITLRTQLPAGSDVLALYTLIPPDNSWNIASDNQVTNGRVTAVGTMVVDTNCNSTIESYGPFPLLDQGVSG